MRGWFAGRSIGRRCGFCRLIHTNAGRGAYHYVTIDVILVTTRTWRSQYLN
jgi:hypothetical protein